MVNFCPTPKYALEHLSFTSLTEAMKHVLAGGAESCISSLSSMQTVTLTFRRSPMNLAKMPFFEQTHLFYSFAEQQWLLSEWYLSSFVQDGKQGRMDTDLLLAKSLAALQEMKPIQLAKKELYVATADELGSFVYYDGSHLNGDLVESWLRVLTTMGLRIGDNSYVLVRREGTSVQLGPFPQYDNQEWSARSPLTAWRLVRK